MSKHINLVINDTLYSSIISYMNTNNIKNFSFAVRILLMKQLDKLDDSNVTNLEDQNDSEEITNELAKYVANEFVKYFTPLSDSEICDQ